MDLHLKLLRQFEHEAANTRKMLQRVPEEHFDWRPHAKSMTLKELAAHIAELPRLFIAKVLTLEEFDFSKGTYRPFAGTTHQELMQFFEDNYQRSVEALSQTTAEEIEKPWSLKSGDRTLFTMPRQAVIRNIAISHFIHHRGQLSVYLRLLDVPVPGMYGPTADEGFGG
ncbi:DinB family protein [Rufibacter glacialis]|uniref:DinB family protein n=1 Tax=Rufibacter glacialis TaxID=1259555 RepID=A0A5M8Q7H2_9BACT|nr:DinB family protein [Rufibacter glacialis]KAA6430770.1 hypothetical protein FOE74_20090 [Rufibacter glacialis]GGK86585.1 hypothetical protein GCM10011405_37930 [Rufibacter glacialis]